MHIEGLQGGYVASWGPSLLTFFLFPRPACCYDPSPPTMDPSAAALSTTAAAALPPAVDNTLGALLLGTCFGFMLYGVMLYQAYRYYQLYPKDRFMLKLLVTVIVITESLHMSIWAIGCYEYLVANYFNPAYAAETHWFMQTLVVFTDASVLVCQLFYTARIYYFGPEWRCRIPAFVALIIQLSFVGWTFAAVAKVYQAKSAEEFSHSTWYVSVCFGHAVVCDVVLAGALVYILHNNRTGMKNTDNILDKLIVYAINTGVLTTIFGLLVFVFSVVYPTNFIYAGISVAGVKLYSNSVLAMLNSRKSLSDKMINNVPAGDSISLTSYRPSAATSLPRPSGITVSRTQTVTVGVNAWPGKISHHAESNLDVEKGAGIPFDNRHSKRGAEKYDGVEDELGFTR
ncbi:hypothetical protein C2E23DRAFT_401022 [Lenzites betulinus]|nr:hypothetical protein C2E23DRAFT_401022 [Lenzites betulinus]